MRTIYKQKLDICDYQVVELPGDYRVLHLDVQGGCVCMWYECDSDTPRQKVEILCFGTGHRMPDYATPDGAVNYLGTVLTEGGMCVWHYYQRRWL